MALMIVLCAGCAASHPTARAESPSDWTKRDGLTLPVRNVYGVHLLGDRASGQALEQMKWARHLVGEWGHCKTLFMNITAATAGPQPHWQHWVATCYEMKMVPLVRLAGVMRDGQWVKPKPDAPGDYHSLAAAIKRVVDGLPRDDRCPLYVEVWNEPNLAVEWSGKPNAQEFADFFVDAAAAIRSIGDPRIVILNGGLGTDPEFAEQLCQANPEFVNAFDVWASHPYPMNRPPSINLHDGTAKTAQKHTIDSYILETNVLARYGRPNVKVMLTETGWDLGNGVFMKSEGWPIINETNRAKYVTRAFRDYWSKWDEVVAVFPFVFAGQGWERFEWVYPDSGTNRDGSPMKPHLQYTAVAALAKPLDPTGAINGSVRLDAFDIPIADVAITGRPRELDATTNEAGSFWIADVRPGRYQLAFKRPGFERYRTSVKVAAGENAVLQPKIKAEAYGTLKGVVRDGVHDEPLDHVMLSLSPASCKPAETDHEGNFGPIQLLPVAYALTLSKEGYETVTLPGISVAANQTLRLDLPLGRKQSPDWPNLLGNPSFEQGGGGGGRDGIALRFEPVAMGECSLSREQARSGHYSQAIHAGRELVTIRQITHYNTARPGKTYVGAIWCRTEDLKGQGAAITVTFTRNDGGRSERVGPSTAVQGTSREWKYLEVKGPCPPEAERVSLNLHVAAGSGVAYFDDAYLGAEP